MWILSLVIFTHLSTIGLADCADPISEIKKTIKKYSDSSVVRAEITKVVELSLLDEVKNSKGQIYIAKGKLRLEINEPENTLLILNPNAIWLVNEVSMGDENKKQVLKITSDKGHYEKAPLAMLLSNPKAWDHFRVKNHSASEGALKIELEPKNHGQFGEIGKIEIDIQKKKNEIVRLSYIDDMDNKTTLNFSGIRFRTKMNSKLFDYKPAKGAEVTEY